jgi:hypothetical protein
MSDDKELNDILDASPSRRRRRDRADHDESPAVCEKGVDPDAWSRSNVQWTSGDDLRFIPAAKTCRKLPPGAYEIKSNPNVGTYFEKIPVSIDGLVRFPQANTDKVLLEIQKFWEREALFREYRQTYKRGILMWGPPGGGKSCCIKFVMKDVIEERKGIVIKFTNPHMFVEGMRILREIEPNTPVVVLLEDIDSTIERWSETEVLNILDGVDKIDRVVFLATTNYPELLGARIINRPSRFDKRFKIDKPNPESRMIFLKHILCDEARAAKEKLTPEKREQFIKKRAAELGINLDKWVRDSDGFSISHLKELFIAVIILGDEYADAIKTLKSMKDQIRHGDDDGTTKMGFI